MASLPIYDMKGSPVGTYDIDLDQFAPPINRQLLHDAVVMYQANRRQGSHQTKSRGMVAGSTQKMYRQKGTGNARAGSKRSGIRRGGGHIFAKQPRDYSYRLPKKALRAATRMALAGKIQNEQVLVLDDLSLSAPQTKAVAGLLQALGLQGQTTLIATESYDANVYKSARNIQRVSVAPIAELNAYSLLRPRRVLMTRSAMDAMQNRSLADRDDQSVAVEGENSDTGGGA